MTFELKLIYFWDWYLEKHSSTFRISEDIPQYAIWNCYQSIKANLVVVIFVVIVRVMRMMIKTHDFGF